MKPSTTAKLIVAALVCVIGTTLGISQLIDPKFEILPPTPSGTGEGIIIRLRLESQASGSAYIIQSSTNLLTWDTVIAYKWHSDDSVLVWDFNTTNLFEFFRLLKASSLFDNIPPEWPNGVNGRFTNSPPGNIVTFWDPAYDVFGVTEYRLYVNGTMVTNVPGYIFSQDFTLNLRGRSDIRIQAVDSSENVSDILSLVYLPGEHLVAVGDAEGRLSVFHVQADGSFSPRTEVADFPGIDWGAGLGDFDHDGFVDLIGGHGSSGAMTPFFFKGKGDGTFWPGVALDTASGANGYMMDGAVGDFDCDGNLDFAVNGNERNVFFYWGRGNGKFDLDVKDWGASGRGMDAGDFNEDGREDLVRGTASDGRLRLFLSNGDRTFQEGSAPGTAGDNPYGLAAGDFDEDGHLDLVANVGDTGEVLFFKGLGNGSFGTPGTNDIRTNLYSGELVAFDAYDYDANGHLDFLISTDDSHSVLLAPGLGDGTFDTNLVTISTEVGRSLGLAAPPLPPRVDVSIFPTNALARAGQPFSFSAVGSGVSSNDFFRWTFGDQGGNPLAWLFTPGMPNMGQTISHSFAREGRVLTRLWHTDARNINSVRGTWVTVRGDPPIAKAGGPYALDEKAAYQGAWQATLDGSGSTDDGAIARYLWTFGDGTSLTNVISPKHTWPTLGPWNVTLEVTDFAGQSAQDATTVTFTIGVPPVAAITGPALIDETSAREGVWRSVFSGSQSTDDAGIWKYDWQFGNGQTATGVNPTAAYGAPGDYTVSLTVTDHAGQTSSTNHPVTVKANNPPTAVISGLRHLSEQAATNGVWYGTWDGLASTDDVGVYRWDWDFGDGSTGSGATVTHGFKGVGVYRITLKVYDHANQTATTTMDIAVTASDPPVAHIMASTTSPEGDEPVTLSGLTSTDDNGFSSYRWLLPPRRFEFHGKYLDGSLWSADNALQDDKLLITGQGNWGQAYCFSIGLPLIRAGFVEGRIDASSGSSRAVVGLKNRDATTGRMQGFPYALYFNNGALEIMEYGNSRGKVADYAGGSSYDFRIETKPGSGALYFLRPSGTGQPFAQVFESAQYTDTQFSYGIDVAAGSFGLDDLVVGGSLSTKPEFATGLFPGGDVTLVTVDNALQTSSAQITITPIVGERPIAALNGPTTAKAGIELQFNGYGSTDDHAVASYTWDFGDGTPLQFGPAVMHRYAASGVYTVKLTVMDYAGQDDTATLILDVAEGNLLACIPWLIISNIELPHETYPDKVVTLKAVARGIPLPFDYTWDFGDGSDPVTGIATSVAEAYSLEARHAYSGIEGTPFYATISVTLPDGNTASDTYPIILRNRSIDVEMKVAIDEGLWYLHKTQNRYDIAGGHLGGYWTYSGGANVNATSSGIQAFGINGHQYTDDGDQDPYVETVQRGAHYLLQTMRTDNIGPQAYGDPDGNANGFALSSNNGNDPYQTGPLMDGLVATLRPELIAAVGVANAKGRPFREIMQDLVDIYCWGQYDDPTVGGGWRYSWNQWPDNSASQWGGIGLLAAERYWNIRTPLWAKERNKVWVAYSRGGSGFGYTGPGDGEATTPSGLVQLAADGVTVDDPLWKHGENFLANNWPSLMRGNNLYAHYAIAKALRTANPQAVEKLALTGKEWFLDPIDGLARTTINRQRSDGSWLSAHYVQEDMSTAWSVIILSSSLFQRGPVAVVHLRPNPTAVNFPVVFDARGSFHQHPAYKVVDYRWDFDASNGVDFNHPDAVGPVVTNAYAALGAYTVTLQVRDNAKPQLLDTATAEVRATLAPHPPSADAGGPYIAATGEDVHLDGGGSFDLDALAGDYIQSWDWETDFHMPLDFDDGLSGTQVVLAGGFATTGQHRVGLRVTDATSTVFPTSGSPDLTGEDFAFVNVYAPLIDDLAARPKMNKCQLTWTKVGDYAVVIRSQSGPNRGFVEIGRTDSDYATFLDTTIEMNVGYYYRVYVYQDGRPDPIGISGVEYVISQGDGIDNLPPYFEETPPTAALVGELYEEHLKAKDPENDPLIFNLLSGPTNLTVDSVSGLILFRPTAEQVGPVPVMCEVTNASGRDVLEFQIVVMPRTNQPPVVSINGPYAAIAGQPIQFSSAGTTDPEGEPILYAWAFGDGNVSTNANPVHTYYAAGTFTVGLIASDGSGGTSGAQTEAVIIRANQRPTAVAGPNQRVPVGQTVQLDGTQSTDPDLDSLSYRWSLVIRPAESNATLTNATTARPTFAPDRPGTYVAQLVVNDGQTNSVPDAVIITTANSAPVANAGPDQRVPEGQTAQLDGSASRDIDLNALTYRWSFASRPDGSAAALSDPAAVRPSFVVDLAGMYTIQLVVNDGTLDSALDTVRVATGNFPPVILSVPPTNAMPDMLWRYDILASDPNDTVLAYAPVVMPDGMAMDADGRMTWTPTAAQIGDHPVTVRVTDAENAWVEQAFVVTVSRDAQPPVVTLTLVQGQIVPETGQWSAPINSTVKIQATATDNVGVTTLTLRLGTNDLALDAGGVATFTASELGLFNVVGTATDKEGNVGLASKTLWVRDPNASTESDIYVLFHSPTNSATVTKPVPVIATITNATDLLWYRVDFARAADLDLGYIAIEGPQFTTLTNVTLPAGTRQITETALAQFDPTMLLNDEYLIRIVASDGPTLQYSGVIVGVSGNLKFGEFRLEFTDLSVPVAGIPITVTRVYDTREANRIGDFGYGWSLGLRDAKIRKTLRNGTMYLGSRVYINTPDGRRVGFTTWYQPSSWLFQWLGFVNLTPDAGVYEKLEILGNTVVYLGGSFYGGLGDSNYDPNQFRLTAKDGTVYSYDTGEGLQNIVDLKGNQLVFNRDGIFHLSSGSTSPDQSVRFVRDSQGRIVQVIDPAGNALKYTYDAAGDLRSFTDQVTNVTQYLYHTARAHFLTNIIDPLGHQTMRVVYDDAGRLASVIDANGNPVVQEQIDPNTVKFTDANGNPQIIRYDDNGNEVMKVIPGISTNYFAYDANNNEIWRQDARGFVSTRAYDSRGNLTHIVDALTNKTSITYNDINKPTSITDPIGNTTALHYDNRGELTNVVNALGANAYFVVDGQGRVTATTDFNGHTTHYVYEDGCSCGKPSRIINPDSTEQHYEYNVQGLPIRKTDELGHTTLLTYDNAGKLLLQTNPDGHATAHTYAGHLKASTTDPLGRTTSYAYDDATRLIATTRSDGSVTRYAYDATTNIVAMTDPVGNVTRFSYDAANRLKYRVDASGHTNWFTYDASNNLLETVDRNGRRRTFLYDALNRRTTEHWWHANQTADTLTYTYSPAGLLVGATSKTVTNLFEFDPLRRVTRAATIPAAGRAVTLEYQYDNLGNVLLLKDNIGITLLSEYDVRNRLTHRAWNGDAIPAGSVAFAYDSAGNCTNITRKNNSLNTTQVVRSTFGFAAGGMPTFIDHQKSDDTSILRFMYQYNAAEELTTRTTLHVAASLTYDLAGQLTNVLYAPQLQSNESYSYDSNGNPTGSAYTVTIGNQVAEDATFHYEYDAEGSIERRISKISRGTTTYTYDHRARLIKVIDSSADGQITQTVLFEYDALNRRVRKTVNQESMLTYHDQHNLWAEVRSDNQTAVHYVMSDTTDEVIARLPDSEPLQWYLNDMLKTTCAIVDSSGVVLNEVVYDVFGSIVSQTDASRHIKLFFAGRDFDVESGLVYMRSRYYYPNLRRYLSEDVFPLSADDPNPYRYARNAPSIYTDPTGLSVLIEYVQRAAESTRRAVLACVRSLGENIIPTTIYIIAALDTSGLADAYVGRTDQGSDRRFRQHIARNRFRNAIAGMLAEMAVPSSHKRAFEQYAMDLFDFFIGEEGHRLNKRREIPKRPRLTCADVIDYAQ